MLIYDTHDIANVQYGTITPLLELPDRGKAQRRRQQETQNGQQLD